MEKTTDQFKKTGNPLFKLKAWEYILIIVTLVFVVFFQRNPSNDSSLLIAIAIMLFLVSSTYRRAIIKLEQRIQALENNSEPIN